MDSFFLNKKSQSMPEDVHQEGEAAEVSTLYQSEVYASASAGAAGDSSAGVDSHLDDFFSLIREEHLAEAQEFRRKGYNSQVPEIDPNLLPRLLEAVAAAKPLYAEQTTPRRSVPWQQTLLSQLDEFINSKVSADKLQSLINDQITRVPVKEGRQEKLGNRKTAQSLARRLESILQTLTLVANALGIITDDTVSKAEKSAALAVANNAARLDARKARELRIWSGSALVFFSDIATLLNNISGKFEKAFASSGPLPAKLQAEKTPKDLQVEEKIPSLVQDMKDFYNKNLVPAKSKIAIALSKASGFMNRGTSTVNLFPPEYPEDVEVTKKINFLLGPIIRSVLWQWQQQAMAIQRASGAIKSKSGELEKIQHLFKSDAIIHEEGGKVNGPAASGREQSGNTQTRAALTNIEDQSDAMLSRLKSMLDNDIANACKLIKRLGSTRESIHQALAREGDSIKKMLDQHVIDDFYEPVSMAGIYEPVWNALNKRLPNIAEDFSISIKELNQAIIQAGPLTRDFSMAKIQANNAELKALSIKEAISTESIKLTHQSVDENSRGVRLAKHWASIAKEQGFAKGLATEPRWVHASLQKHGLLEETLSSGDPLGYLFATRLAAELENARNDELILPMSPDEYVAMEKSVDEFIVSFGQKRVTRGMGRQIAELSFEQSLSAITFNLSSVIRLPYKVIKASIKIPHKVSKVNNYTMPGQDRPYKAISTLLNKRLTQLGFNLVASPVPSLIKLPVGAAITAMGIGYNQSIKAGESTLASVYGRVVEGEKSKKYKLPTLSGAAVDVLIEGAISSAIKGTGKGIRLIFSDSKMSQDDIDKLLAEYNKSKLRDPGDRENTSVDLGVESHLARIAKSEDAKLAALAKNLLALQGRATIKLRQSSLSGASENEYDMETRTITLAAGASDEEVLHEIAHALSAHQVLVGLNDPDTELGEHVRQLDELRARALAAYLRSGGKDDQALYYLNSPYEFIAGIYSGDGEFTHFLGSIDEQGKSLLTRAIDFMCLLLGLDVEQKSALTGAMGLSNEIMGVTLAEGEGDAQVKLGSENDSFKRQYLIAMIKAQNPPAPIPIDWATFQGITTGPDQRQRLVRWLSTLSILERKKWFARRSSSSLSDFNTSLRIALAQDYFIYEEMVSGPDYFKWVNEYKSSEISWPRNFHQEEGVVGILRDPRSPATFPAGKGFLFILKDKSGKCIFSKVYYPQGEGSNTNDTGVWHENILKQIEKDMLTLAENHRVTIKNISNYNTSSPQLVDGSVQSSATNVFTRIEGSEVHSADFRFVDRPPATVKLSNNYEELIIQIERLKINKLSKARQKAFTKKIIELYTRLDNNLNSMREHYLNYHAGVAALDMHRRFTHYPAEYNSSNSTTALLNERNEINRQITELKATNDTEVAAEIQALEILEASNTSQQFADGKLSDNDEYLSEDEEELSEDEEELSEDDEELTTMPQDPIDDMLIASLKERGYTISKDDLDSPIYVTGSAFGQLSQTPNEDIVYSTATPNNLLGDPVQAYTLRQLLLGEYDRNRAHGDSIALRNPESDANKRLPAGLLNDLRFKNLRRAYADEVNTGINAHADTLSNDPVVRGNYKANVNELLPSIIIDNIDELKDKNDAYAEIAKGILLGLIKPTEVYYNGGFVPNLVAYGQGNFRILVSLDTKKIKAFNTVSNDDTSLPAFIRSHLPTEQRTNDISMWLTFGKGGEALYDSLYNELINRLKRDLSSLVLTSGEEFVTRRRENLKNVIFALGIILTVATMGTSTPISVGVGVAATIISGIAEIHIDEQTANDADRSEARDAARDSATLSKYMLGFAIPLELLPFVGKLKSAKNAGELRTALSELSTRAKTLQTAKTAKPSRSGAGRSMSSGTVSTENAGSAALPAGQFTNPRYPGARGQGRTVPSGNGRRLYGRKNPMSSPRGDSELDELNQWRNTQGVLTQFPTSQRTTGVDVSNMTLGMQGHFRGVYTDISVTPNRYYAMQDQHIFELKYDADVGAWRLQNPSQPRMGGYHPAVRFDPLNGWEYRANVGLQGGSRSRVAVNVPPRPAPANRLTGNLDQDLSGTELRAIQQKIAEGDYPAKEMRDNFVYGENSSLQAQMRTPEEAAEQATRQTAVRKNLNAVENLKSYEKGNTLYRGSAMSQENVDSLQTGSTVQAQQLGFFSESKLVSTEFIGGDKQVNVMWRVKNPPKGQFKNGLKNVDHYGNISSYLQRVGRTDNGKITIGSAAEVVVQQGAVFRVVSVRKIRMKIKGKDEVVYKIDLEYIGTDADVHDFSLQGTSGNAANQTPSSNAASVSSNNEIVVPE